MVAVVKQTDIPAFPSFRQKMTTALQVAQGTGSGKESACTEGVATNHITYMQLRRFVVRQVEHFIPFLL